ncbi:Putative zn(2)-C6 fungal-type DNA-binding domain-containing protein [Septoria linicola]|uniref:Zn(2)-C6 fungal-type DNA-binding domain-containing protein n=1 Tax=Septoria linicola TaxID=215465 RepID=A0A9Q9AVD6_9PEZI|nr:Putative zn(2)-C6 fungal-type DNA-binding domain-containing protein [Septoria linicola]
MWPRLNHKKARTGCQRCKARKVKCDEGKPKCSACTRHNVLCEYIDPQPRRTDGGHSMTSLPGYTNAFPSNPNLTPALHAPAFANELRLELRLMRQWTVETCNTFAMDPEFWQKQATELGLEHRMILDAMFSLSALHIAWPSSPSELNGSVNMLSFDAPIRKEMILNAQKYLQRALEGHTAAMGGMNEENAGAVYTASVLLLYYSFFNLGEIAYDPTLPGYDHTFWTRLSGHTHFWCEKWSAMEGGEQAIKDWGVIFGRSQPQEAEELFSREQGKPFTELLKFAEEYEASSTDDKAVYQQSVAYLALVHKSINESQDPALLNCQRLVAMPSQLGRRFTELLEHRQPRALLILAHVFATTKLLSAQVPWLRGIAERQVPPIQQHIPPAWQGMLKWPMETTFGPQPTNDNIESANEQSLRDILQYQAEEAGQETSAAPS